MSSTSGGGFRGRGRGSSATPSTSSRGRGTSSRGRVSHGSAPRGSTASRGMFGQFSQQNPFQASRGSSTTKTNGARQSTAPRSASNTAKTRGSWQERYQTLMQARERERAEAIRNGQIADPDKPRSLSEALTPIGTCQDMCAEYERVQRVVQKDVWDEETNPNQSAFATTEKEPDESRMVKKFRRAAAGLEEQLPSDLRPPHILKQTCDYLFNEVIGHAPSLAHVHHFVWDRTRAIRNDFSIQQVTKPDELRMAIECYERIARFHLLSLHQLALPQKPYSKYDGQQEREQLDRTLLSLMQYYDDSRGRIDHPNEAEFRAYCVIFQLQDPTPDLEDRVQTWPKAIIQDKRVQTAVDLYMSACNVMDPQGPLKPRANHLIARQDWQNFWTLVASKEVSYLMACTAEIYFNLVRRTVLNALFRTFRNNSTMATPDWTVDLLCDLLAFDDEDEVYTYCERFGFSFKEREDRQQYLDLTSVRGRTLPEPTAGPKQMKSSLVENKRMGRTLPAVINGLNVKQAQDRGLVGEEEEHDQSMNDANDNSLLDGGFGGGGQNGGQLGADDEDSLFIPETTKPSFTQPNRSITSTTMPQNLGQSIFSGGQSGTSTFGRPSNYSEQTSIFAQPQNKTPSVFSSAPQDASKPTFDFTKPAASTFGAPSSSGSPFNFTTTPQNTAVETKNSKLPTFTFGQPSTNDSGVTKSAQPVSEPSTTIAGTQQATTNATLFSLTPPTETGLKVDTAPEQPPPSKSPHLAVESRSPSPEQPKPSFTFGTPSAAPAPLPSAQPQPQPQPPSTSPSTSPTATSKSQFGASSNSNNGVKRPSFSTDTKPKKPSPLSNSITAGEESGAVTTETLRSTNLAPERDVQATTPVTKKVEARGSESAAHEFDSVVTRLTDDLCNDPDVGIFQQYIEHAVGKIALDVFKRFTEERDKRRLKQLRQSTIKRKYARKWIDWFWQRRLAKTGRERRERRQRRLQQRDSQRVDGASMYGAEPVDRRNKDGAVYSTAPASSVSGKEMESTVSKQTLDTTRSPRAIGNNQSTMASSHAAKSSTANHTPAASRGLAHRRLKSTSHVDERGRITKPTQSIQPQTDASKRSAMLDLTVTQRSPNDNKDTTVSNYFRHKALGLNKIDQSTGVRGIKRRSESLQISPETSPPALRPHSRNAWSPEASASKALMKPPSSAPSRVAQRNEEDEALFARLRAARENLKLGMSPLSDEPLQADAFRRSASSQSSTDSPSMQKARIDARLRASQGLSKHDGASERSVPAYRLRESRFVPRQHYGRAIERAKEIRESRSRETSRPESQAGRRTPELTKQAMESTHPLNRHIDAPLQDSVFHNHAFETQNEFPANSIPADNKAPIKIPPKPFGFQKSEPLSFSNHTTQLPPDNPFLQSQTTNALNGLSAQPTWGFQPIQKPMDGPQDFTIPETQIPESLANSFGSGRGFGTYPQHSEAQPMAMLPQQDSYMHTNPIDLTSDDEDEESNNVDEIRQAYANMNAEMDGETEELLDNRTDDEEEAADDMLVHPSGYVEVDRQSDESASEESDDAGQVMHHHYPDPRTVLFGEGNEESGDDADGYSDDQDELIEDGGVEGDIEDEETKVDEEDEQSEEDEDDYVEGGFAAQQHRLQHPPQYDRQASGAPSQSSALQQIGGTPDAAIELDSD